MSLEACQALATLIDEGTRLDKKEYMVNKLIVDDGGMDDEKLAYILECLNRQKTLKSITLMNCRLEKKAMKPLLEILTRKYPASVERFRLVNVARLQNMPVSLTSNLFEEL
mmetsp:Transcript_35425/g.54200  ORF Transcript_35425/g.54200 Transcript_35425/m.54200 type:complete len:111 (+) Transcript_35425:96-428(+)